MFNFKQHNDTPNKIYIAIATGICISWLIVSYYIIK